MSAQFPQTLTPKMVKGIKGFNLCAYLIGMEGWRRGLSLKFYGDINQASNIYTRGGKLIGRSYSLESKDKIHYFNQSRGDIVSNKAAKIANNKQRTKEYLQRNGIYIMPSKRFKKTTLDKEIIKESTKIGFPLVLKPTYGTLSKGVVLDIKNELELEDALIHVRRKLGYKSVIIEKYFEGEDIRLYVVNDTAVAALKRTPAKVTGDGESTIKGLINKKNGERKNNPYLAARPIKIDHEVKSVLRKNNYHLDSVLEKGQTILVKNKSTLTQGVDLYDLTDEIPEDIKQLAVDTLNSIPNIKHGSIDMLYNGREAVVLEVNASANISMHMFPTKGKSRNIPAFIMDFYFPETKQRSLNHSNMYFDYLNIVEILKRNYTNYIEVKSLPEGSIYAKRYVVSGKVQMVGYRNWIRRMAIQKEIHGFARKLDDHRVEVVVASDNLENVDEFEELCGKGSEKSKVDSVKVYKWEKEIKMGFELTESTLT